MSLEAKIEELNGTMTALIAALEKVSVNQERLIAGQQAAIEKVAAGNPEKPTRGRPKKDTPPPSDEPADTASGADDAGSASEQPAEAAEAEKKEEPKPAAPAPAPAPAPAAAGSFAVSAKKWMDKGKEVSDEEFKKRGVAVVSILGNFGAGKMSELPADAEPKAIFFLKRFVKGCTVNFDAAYDFDGAPDQPEPEAAAAPAADDEDDIFG